ncbi:MAG: nicotinate-nucleotide diphosphorylase (carboxylating) [Candidatus Marinimicrobia bacterium]|nr:nicotinate-nucleotide diphosphorylase (carboxylating) [Candidatus Neomarinimicrobiota bacterium]MBV67701.1 nicotinate-nucleotide diphosphorylase (carboxylating) [Candidatus Neomarinimicrobiota bacterium]|tara:strand:- start:5365 stop:6237 length:873 start_codon:yes stop_codon:yes gene_type:complete
MSSAKLLYKQINKLDPKQVSKKLKEFLKEDVPAGDATTKNIVLIDTKEVFAIQPRESMIFCGNPIIENIFSPKVKVKKMVKDGQKLLSGQTIALLSGSNSEILTKERLLLNMIQRMSGVSSLTGKYVEKLNNNKIKVLDTRKTTPGLRLFEKYAVFCGGGSNHRLNLSSGIMVKDNHINKITDEVADKLTRISPSVPIQFEVDSPKQINSQNVSLVDAFLLDNMTPNKIKKCIEKINLLKNKDKKIFIEVSGGVTLKNISKFNLKGVNGISVGALTHQSTNVDIGLDLHS